MIDRILQIIDYKGITKSKFYKETGLSNGFLDKVKDIGVSKLDYILKAYPDININWLISGEGNMIKENTETIIQKNNRFADPYFLKLTDLGLLLTDNMKFLSFIVSVLHENDYHFDKKETDTINYYRDLEKDYENIRLGVDVLNPEDFDKVQFIIRSELFGFINNMILKTSDILNLKEPFYF
ncbi:hypothetical protein SAMN05421796_11050 [Chryseobacterium piscicola]|uniref:Uncharacterized protein n=1 Tax=Chryseobacterium piscicola TaxID=551459 RepID=A0A1N7P0S2_9FLAO|nr:hypothetical protein [Chryseobacterium piscicola]PQA92765.1 hypothetical protein B0A70_10290 [Chryseobacterium piscicola]SIT04173.1 hypothetical protein SAMN05421796_11050 [Chryseobacterium piscicola]